MGASFAVIDRAYMTIQNLLNAAFPYLTNMVWLWFGTMCAWAAVLAVIEWLDGKSPVAMIGGAFIRLGIFVYLASVWKLIIDGLGTMALEIGLKISGATARPEEIMSPSGIFTLGNNEANKIMDAKNAMCDSWTSCIITFGDQLLLELIIIGIWICFAVLTLALIIAALTFKKHGLFAFIFLPMSQLRATAFLTESAISGVIQGAVWLAFIAMVAGFGSIIFKFMVIPDDPAIGDIIPAFLVYAFIGVMGWQSRSFAQGIVTGSTRIGGEAMTAAARNTLSWATGAGAIAQSLHAAGHVAESFSKKAYATQTAQKISQEVGHAARTVAAKAQGKPTPPRPDPPTANTNRTGATSGKHRGGKWDLEPTEKQKHAAKQRGVDISGMTRGRASEVLETQGKMDPSWYKEM
jgi:TrbL/VirB6 plasmid conjugal transfer protein